MTEPYVDLEALKQKTAQIVARAKAMGASTAMADLHQKTDFLVEVRNQNIEHLSEAESFGLYLTVSKDGRRATVTSCDLSPESIETLIGHALNLCKYTDHDPFYTMPESELLATEVQDYDLFDPDLPRLAIRDRIERARELERCLTAKDPRLKSDGASISTVIAASALANSLGFCQGEVSGMIGSSVAAFAEDEVQRGDLNIGRKQTGYWSAKARHLKDLAEPDEVAGRAARDVLRKLGARKPKSGKFPVYFEPSMAKTLWGHFLKAIKGTAIFRNESYLVDRLGTGVCSPNITIIDDPTIIRGLRSRSFDDEGVACRASDIVRDGELKTYMMSTYSANKLGLHSTGHAGGSSNVLIAPGALSEAEMIRKMDRGVWITSLLGAGTNISTGDYTRGALGLWVENGEVVHPVMEFTLNSHLDAMFQNIVMLGNNVYKNDSVRTPGLVIEEMSISGA